GLDVGLHRTFHAHALRREQPRRFDALLVHAAQPRIAIEPLGMRVRVLTRQLVSETRLVALAGEVVVERAWARARGHVARAGDDRVNTTTREDVPRLAAAVEVDEPNTALRELRVAIASERLGRLPVVVVGVEDRRDCLHHGSLRSRL